MLLSDRQIITPCQILMNKPSLSSAAHPPSASNLLPVSEAPPFLALTLTSRHSKTAQYVAVPILLFRQV